MPIDPAHGPADSTAGGLSGSCTTALPVRELERRAARPSDFESESQALLELMKALKDPVCNVFDKLAETARDLCRAQSAGVSLVEEHGRRLCNQGLAGRARELQTQFPELTSSLWERLLQRGESLLLMHPERSQISLSAASAGLPLAEALVVPFAVDDVWVGAVWVVLHDDSQHFDREDLRLLSSLSECASVGFQVLRRGMQMQESLARERLGLQLLQAISAGLTREEEAGALYDQILDAAQTIMRSDAASMRMVEEGALRMLAWRGFHPLSAQAWQRSNIDASSESGMRLLRGERYVLTDLEVGERRLSSTDIQELRRSRIRAMQATPLLSRSGELIGVLSTHWHVPHTPTAAELDLFDVLTRLAVDLIERARMDEARRESDRRKNEFLAVLSHELRNPLAPITTGLEMLRRAEAHPELLQSIHAMMTRQVGHLTRLVNDLLDLSRISRGTVELRCEPLKMSDVIEAAVELARPLIDQRSHDLVVEQPPRSPWVNGDRERLTQVISNVLSNAARYTDPGGHIALRVSLEKQEVVIRIEDSGVGIPGDRLETVFEMFAQVPEHKSRRGGSGLGIGLALSRRLVELHGGSILARSQGLGRGSEFVIRLPRIEAPAAAQAEPSATENCREQGRRVLIIEDNVDAASTLRVALELEGHSVQVAHTATAGLARIGSFSPEAVLLDIGLPDMDGYETARRIRALPGGGARQLIAITGWGQASDRERSREAGFNLHLTKPVSLPVLLEALKEMHPTPHP